MRTLSTLLAKGPKWIVIILLVLAFVFGSHAGLDYLVAFLGDSCVPLDATTRLCLLSDDTAA